MVAADPTRPLVTFYDDATGERIELSGRTFANWVAKTANLLVDGLDAEPGDRVALALPPHWQTAVWLMACWSAGVVAVPVEAAGLGDVDADVVVAAEALLPQVPAETGAREVVGLSLHSLGAPLAAAPAGVVDYAADIRTYGDDFVPYAVTNPNEPALVVSNTTFTAAELVDRGREMALTWQLDAGSRILTDLPFITLEGVLVTLLAPLTANSSVIILRNLDKAALDRRISLEHVTAVAGVPGWDPGTGPVRRLL
ncbi:TIGR03089 family protein [Actinomadura alba]